MRILCQLGLLYLRVVYLWRGGVTYKPATRLLSMVGLCMALTAPPASAQTEAVELRFQLKPEEILRYTVVQSSLTWGEVYVNGVMRTFLDRQSTTLREEIRATAVGEDGTMSLEVTRQEIKTTRAGGPQQPLQPFGAKVRSNGEIVEERAGLGASYFPIGLPDGALLLGESWTYKQKGLSWDITKENRMFVKTDITFTATLASVDRVAGDRVAHVQIKGEGVLDAYAAYTTFDAAVFINGATPVHVTGEATWSINHGRLVRLKEETSFEIPVKVAAEGQTFEGKGRLIVTEDREATS